jgi:hypothetical protein
MRMKNCSNKFMLHFWSSSQDINNLVVSYHFLQCRWIIIPLKFSTKCVAVKAPGKERYVYNYCSKKIYEQSSHNDSLLISVMKYQCIHLSGLVHSSTEVECFTNRHLFELTLYIYNRCPNHPINSSTGSPSGHSKCIYYRSWLPHFHQFMSLHIYTFTYISFTSCSWYKLSD